MPVHHLKILATDDEVPPIITTFSLTVTVKDANDNAPRFAQKYKLIVMENEPPRKIAGVFATDEDD